MGHRAGVEGDDLVIGLVGVDEARCGELIGDLHHARRVHPGLVHPRAVLAEVLAGRRHHQGPSAQKRQVVGDVARHPAAHALHRVHQEAHREHVDFVGQDVVLEVARKVHDVVVGE